MRAKLKWRQIQDPQSTLTLTSFPRRPAATRPCFGNLLFHSFRPNSQSISTIPNRWVPVQCYAWTRQLSNCARVVRKATTRRRYEYKNHEAKTVLMVNFLRISICAVLRAQQKQATTTASRANQHRDQCRCRSTRRRRRRSLAVDAHLPADDQIDIFFIPWVLPLSCHWQCLPRRPPDQCRLPSCTTRTHLRRE